jgi:hypothetical protein
MYCERCGNPLAEGSRFCANCGKPMGLSVVPLERQGKVERNLQILAILWLVIGSIELLGSFVLFILGQFFWRFGPSFQSGAPFPPFLRGLFTILGLFVGIKALLSIASGWGLLQREPWARPVAIVAAIFALIHIPLGTALGVYTLWVLAPQESGQEYEQLSNAA